MITKMLEIRDSGTCIPVIAIDTSAVGSKETAFLRKTGFLDSGNVIIIRPDDNLCSYSPYSWATGARTMCVAHQYIEEHFDEIPDCSVIDVRTILSGAPAAKSEIW